MCKHDKTRQVLVRGCFFLKASRLLSTLMLLQARGRVTAPALAEALEVSVRTVLRDLDELSAAGVPVWSERGRGGGFQLSEGWSTKLTGLTEPEMRALFLTNLPQAASALGLSTQAAAARQKMVASLPSLWRAEADSIASRFHVDALEWYRAQETPVFLREVADAVWQGLSIEVHYESWRGASMAQLQPLGLVLKAGAWYLVAQRSGKPSPSTFRLANIRQLQVSNTRFKRPSLFRLSDYWSEAMARFEAELVRETAHISVSPRAVRWFENTRTRLLPVENPLSASSTPKGWSEFLLPIESIEQGVRQLLSYATEVKVLGPAPLREVMTKTVARLRALYTQPKKGAE
jgi:predicted DNA-binding transcriptional regulator YafY